MNNQHQQQLKRWMNGATYCDSRYKVRSRLRSVFVHHKFGTCWKKGMTKKDKSIDGPMIIVVNVKICSEDEQFSLLLSFWLATSFSVSMHTFRCHYRWESAPFSAKKHTSSSLYSMVTNHYEPFLTTRGKIPLQWAKELIKWNLDTNNCFRLFIPSSFHQLRFERKKGYNENELRIERRRRKGEKMTISILVTKYAMRQYGV